MSKLSWRKDMLEVGVNEVHSGSGSPSHVSQGSALMGENFEKPLKGKAAKRAMSLEKGAPLRRYWIRGIIGVFIPIVVVVYWFLVWFIYFIPENPVNDIQFGHSGGRWVFYSWFLIGIFGINLSKYGLVGVEAGMMMDPRWAAKNAMQVMMHVEHSWGGPSGWMKCITDMFIRGENRPQPPTPLWSILAFLSILPFIALPLTGLCMEMTEGYHSTGRHPMVSGVAWDTINFVSGADKKAKTAEMWASGINATFPGRSVVYTAPDVDRSQFPYLQGFPNALPLDDGLQDAFMTEQADVPISGNSWGLRLRYDCKVVTKLSDFTILNKRRSKNKKTPFTYEVDGGAVLVRNSTSQDQRTAGNYGAVLEEGLTPKLIDYNSLDPDACYFKGRNHTEEYPGIDQESAYEAILWQVITNFTGGYQGFNDTGLDLPFNFTLENEITELRGEYEMDWLVGVPDAEGISIANVSGVPTKVDRFWDSMIASGIRCTAGSEVGNADIDGTKSTYKNFQRTDSLMPFLDTCAPKLEFAAPFAITFFSSDSIESGDWMGNMLRSVNAPVGTLTNFSTPAANVISADDDSSELMQLSYFQPRDFRRSMLRTYPAYVEDLMYNAGYGYSNASGFQSITFVNPNVTAYELRKIFENGDVAFWVPGGILIVWAVGSIAITLMYGFRRRWSDSLDGYSMFRFGSDLADRIRERPEFGLNMEWDDCHLLAEMPGLIGDGNMGSNPGHITLVDRKESFADKSKLYR